MKIVLAIDSFKGCLSSFNAEKAVEKGILNVFPDANVIKVPIGDGGEGTLNVFLHKKGFKKINCDISDPNGMRRRAAYLMSNRNAVIESAEGAGLSLMKEPNPLYASSFGVGELMADALKRGARDFVIGLGGTGTTDGGLGALSALGFEFFDSKGSKIAEFGGANLSKVVRISDSNVLPCLRTCRFRLLCDVDNPFYGRRGAACVFAPQKGANESQIEMLDGGLKSFAKIIKKFNGVSLSNMKSAGAAGGLAGGLMALLGASRTNGIETVLDELDFSETLKGADFVVTGEGSLDSQSSSGKAPSGVAKRAAKVGVPVIAIGGRILDGAEKLYTLGISSMFSIQREPITLSQSTCESVALHNLSDCSERIFRLIKCARLV